MPCLCRDNCVHTLSFNSYSYMSFNNKYFTSYLVIAHGVVFMEPRQSAKTVMLPGGSVQDAQGLGWLHTGPAHPGGRER